MPAPPLNWTVHIYLFPNIPPPPLHRAVANTHPWLVIMTCNHNHLLPFTNSLPIERDSSKGRLPPVYVLGRNQHHSFLGSVLEFRSAHRSEAKDGKGNLFLSIVPRLPPPSQRHLSRLIYTYIIPILGHGSACQLPDLLPVHLGCTAIILGTGICGGAPMLAEKGSLKGRNSVGFRN